MKVVGLQDLADKFGSSANLARSRALMHCLSNYFEVDVIVLVTSLHDSGDAGVHPTVSYRAYDITHGAREKTIVLHLRDAGHGGHYEAVLVDDNGVLDSNHFFLCNIRTSQLFTTSLN